MNILLEVYPLHPACKKGTAQWNYLSFIAGDSRQRPVDRRHRRDRWDARGGRQRRGDAGTAREEKSKGLNYSIVYGDKQQRRHRQAPSKCRCVRAGTRLRTRGNVVRGSMIDRRDKGERSDRRANRRGVEVDCRPAVFFLSRRWLWQRQRGGKGYWRRSGA